MKLRHYKCRQPTKMPSGAHVQQMEKPRTTQRGGDMSIGGTQQVAEVRLSPERPPHVLHELGPIPVKLAEVAQTPGCRDRLARHHPVHGPPSHLQVLTNVSDGHGREVFVFCIHGPHSDQDGGRLTKRVWCRFGGKWQELTR